MIGRLWCCLVCKREKSKSFRNEQASGIGNNHLVLTHSLSLYLRHWQVDMPKDEGHVRAQCDVFKSASLVHSPRRAERERLYYSFQVRDHLYLVGMLCFPKLAVEI